MSTVNQQTLAESGASDRPSILEKGSYVPWASQFLRLLDNKKEEGELMRHSNDKGESLTSVYERFATLINVMDRNKLYDHLSQFEPHINASKAKKAAKNHDPLVLVANSHTHSTNSYPNLSYSQSPQPYYVTRPSSIIDYKDDYQREIQGDA
ncbi:hypothetical protein Tco_1250397 [Tanacetum coccineum]